MKSKKSPPAKSSPALAPRPPSRRARWIVFAVVGLLLLGAGAVAWHKAHTRAAWSRQLPARPTVSDLPPAFTDALTAADQRARSSRTRLAGAEELGKLYHANDFLTEAAECWELLRAEQPENGRWHYYLADLRRLAGDSAGLRANLEATVERAPDYAPARLQLANLLFKSGEVAAAEQHFTALIQTLPRDPYVRLGLVRIALHRQDRTGARQRLEALLQDSPHFSSAHNLYAELLTAPGEEEAARRHRWLGRETLRYREPEDPWRDDLLDSCYRYDRLCVAGTLDYQTARIPRARALFERAIALRPQEPQAYTLLADSYLKQNDPARARDILLAAERQLTNRAWPAFFSTLSLAHLRLQQADRALQAAQRGLEHNPRDAELLDALGQAWAALGRHPEALRAWQQGLEIAPGDANLNFNQATSFLALHRLDDALAALDRSLLLQPTFLPTLLLRGEIELQADHLDLAEKYLRPAVEAHPENATARRLWEEWQRRTAPTRVPRE